MVVPNPARKLGTPVVRLDSEYYKIVTDLESRLPYGVPSLMYCQRLVVEGDIKFGRNIVLQGDVRLVNESDRQATTPDGAIISGTWKA
jgi:UTP--glucose-1-phosphate uridylyltransferase